jgi:hypothetical protein
MDRMPWTTYLWPGLTRLWKHGDWSALLWAVGFGLLLNAAVVSTWVWSELLSPGSRSVTWLVVAVWWVAGGLWSRRWNRRQPATETATVDQRFRAAQEHYVRGDWFEAERILTGLVRSNPRDVESRLMLATLLRHTGRTDAAALQLQWLQRLEDAGKWELEICREWELLQQARSAGDVGTTPPAETAAEAATETVKDAA